ncbi:hypothetical protein BDV97DRAFT_371442 [Delphinella strobiligena]|nr:hypothetical protein BDV97DRAFT_371442 [Delphinella strobiligena]
MAAVMAPTPALPPIRKASFWGKMFSKNKKGEVTEMIYSEPQSIGISNSTGYDKSASNLHRRTGSTVSKTPVTCARSASIAPSIKSTKTTASQAGSFSSSYSRRSSKKWWGSSSNPDNDIPPVPVIDANLAARADSIMTGAVSPTTVRKPGYMPRNAAGSFLKTTTPARQTTQDQLNEVTRKLSNQDLKASFAALKPIQIKPVELRKDSHCNVDNVERHGMSSMAGVCDIVEIEEPVDEESLSPTSAFRERNDFPFERSDSARGSPDLIATTQDKVRVPSVHELMA